MAIFFILGLTCFGAEEKQNNQQKCSEWGTSTEITTYQQPYCPLLAPDIPVMQQKQTPKTIVPSLDETAVSPETAIRVVSSDGREYAYYYSDIIRYHVRPGNPPVYEPVKVRARIWIPCPRTPNSPQQGVVGIQSGDTAVVRLRTQIVDADSSADTKPVLPANTNPVPPADTKPVLPR